MAFGAHRSCNRVFRILCPCQPDLLERDSILGPFLAKHLSSLIEAREVVRVLVSGDQDVDFSAGRRLDILHDLFHARPGVRRAWDDSAVDQDMKARITVLLRSTK